MCIRDSSRIDAKVRRVQVHADRRRHEHQFQARVRLDQSPREQHEDLRVDAPLVDLVDDEVRVVVEDGRVRREEPHEVARRAEPDARCGLWH